MLKPSIEFDGLEWTLSRARHPCQCAASHKTIIKGDRVYKPRDKSGRLILAYAFKLAILPSPPNTYAQSLANA